ncbi:hypothetical protein HDU67_005935 [Dinochytrium kinnereticum]|nr:hypothetical protein HDU67_005935 [Dinochytrium kinnereticum]
MITTATLATQNQPSGGCPLPSVLKKSKPLYPHPALSNTNNSGANTLSYTTAAANATASSLSFHQHLALAQQQQQQASTTNLLHQQKPHQDGGNGHGVKNLLRLIAGWVMDHPKRAPAAAAPPPPTSPITLSSPITIEPPTSPARAARLANRVQPSDAIPPPTDKPSSFLEDSKPPRDRRRARRFLQDVNGVGGGGGDVQPQPPLTVLRVEVPQPVVGPPPASSRKRVVSRDDRKSFEDDAVNRPISVASSSIVGHSTVPAARSRSLGRDSSRGGVSGHGGGGGRRRRSVSSPRTPTTHHRSLRHHRHSGARSSTSTGRNALGEGHPTHPPPAGPIPPTPNVMVAPTMDDPLGLKTGVTVSEDGVTVRLFSVGGVTARTVQSLQPVSSGRGLGGMFCYFEVTVLDVGPQRRHRSALPSSSAPPLIAVGLADRHHPADVLPGTIQQSVAYWSDGTKRTHATPMGLEYATGFGKGDTVGCGISNATGGCFFTVNGRYVGEAFYDLRVGGGYLATVGGEGDVLLRLSFGAGGFVYEPANWGALSGGGGGVGLGGGGVGGGVGGLGGEVGCTCCCCVGECFGVDEGSGVPPLTAVTGVSSGAWEVSPGGVGVGVGGDWDAGRHGEWYGGGGEVTGPVMEWYNATGAPPPGFGGGMGVDTMGRRDDAVDALLRGYLSHDVLPSTMTMTTMPTTTTTTLPHSSILIQPPASASFPPTLFAPLGDPSTHLTTTAVPDWRNRMDFSTTPASVDGDDEGWTESVVTTEEGGHSGGEEPTPVAAAVAASDDVGSPSCLVPGRGVMEGTTGSSPRCWREGVDRSRACGDGGEGGLRVGAVMKTVGRGHDDDDGEDGDGSISSATDSGRGVGGGGGGGFGVLEGKGGGGGFGVGGVDEEDDWAILKRLHANRLITYGIIVVLILMIVAVIWLKFF